MKGAFQLLRALSNVGVDPAKPRHETKHIVLTNVFASMWCFSSAVATVFGRGVPVAHLATGIGTAAFSATLFLNRRGWTTAASAWLLATSTGMFLVVGLHEPEEAHHSLLVLLTATIAWFVFPPSKRVASTVATASSLCIALALLWVQRHFPATTPPGYDLGFISLGNQGVFAVLIVAVCIYASREMARVERELVAERARVETLLKREVSHQVAERSRELGQVLARGDIPIAPAALAAGDRFHGRYRIVRPLGEGGMGAVYEVERLPDLEHLALKVITSGVSPTAAARFAREAEIGARVHHANLVSIVDVGIAEGGAPFLVMDLVKGGSLEDRRERFGEASWALPILRQIIDGLAALHEAGVVHRDLKPANVLLSGDEGSFRARISDFGISRFGEIDPTVSVNPEGKTVDLAASPQEEHLTGTGALLGTPLYMAPEAAKGGRVVEAPADIFAFGIIAYEMITGRSPFRVPPVLQALAGQPLPQVVPIKNSVASAVRATVLACLVDDPTARPTATKLREALGA